MNLELTALALAGLLQALLFSQPAQAEPQQARRVGFHPTTSVTHGGVKPHPTKGYP